MLNTLTVDATIFVKCFTPLASTNQTPIGELGFLAGVGIIAYKRRNEIA